MKQTLTNSEYHALPAIGASGLKLLNQAPAKYYAAYLDPNRKPLESTAAMLRGTMIHTACLEPHLFDEQYVTVPDGIDKRTKEGKQLFSDIIASGKAPIKSEDAELALALREVFHRHDFIAFEVLNNTPIIEQSFIADINGVQVKIRPDIWIEPCADFPNGAIIDLKTTADASPAGFGKAITNYEYWLQSALYCMVIQREYNLPEPPPFYWFAQETDAPYLNKVYKCSQVIYEYGVSEAERLLEIYRVSLATGEWFGYGFGIEDAELPIWKQREITASEGEIEVSYV